MTTSIFWTPPRTLENGQEVQWRAVLITVDLCRSPRLDELVALQTP